MAKKINYLNNRDMLAEIHKSKTSYCEYTDECYVDYDLILEDSNDIFNEGYHTTQLVTKKVKNDDGTEDTIEVEEEVYIPSSIEQAMTNRITRLSQTPYYAKLKEHKLNPETVIKPKQSDYKIDPSTVHVDDLVFRVVTYEHIPLAPGRKKNPKRTADKHVKLNFIPFKHYTIKDEEYGLLNEVGRSHSIDGEFSMTHGSMTDTLANMCLLLVNRYSQRSNWRGYSYVSEMKGQALLQLAHMALMFNEAKSANPFSYFTAAITNSFTKVLNMEKRHQNTRDDLLEQQGKNPSFTRQLAHEEQIRKMREDAEKES